MMRDDSLRTAKNSAGSAAAVANLRALAGDRYRVRDDGTQDAMRSERAWCLEIPGAHGSIYPLGDNGDLGVWTASARIAGRLAALGLRLVQGGEESAYRFPPARFEQVAALIQARKRRQLTPEQRAACAARLAGPRNKAVRVPEGGTSRA